MDPGKGWARGLGGSEERWGLEQGWAVAQQKVTPGRSGSTLGQSWSHGGAGSDQEELGLRGTSPPSPAWHSGPCLLPVADGKAPLTGWGNLVLPEKTQRGEKPPANDHVWRGSFQSLTDWSFRGC